MSPEQIDELVAKISDAAVADEVRDALEMLVEEVAALESGIEEESA